MPLPIDDLFPGLPLPHSLPEAGEGLLRLLSLTNDYVARPLSQTAYGGMRELGYPEFSSFGLLPNLGGALIGLGHGILQGGLTDPVKRAQYEALYPEANPIFQFSSEVLFDPLTFASGGPLKNLAARAASGGTLLSKLAPALSLAGTGIDAFNRAMGLPIELPLQGASQALRLARAVRGPVRAGEALVQAIDPRTDEFVMQELKQAGFDSPEEARELILNYKNLSSEEQRRLDELSAYSQAIIAGEPPPPGGFAKPGELTIANEKTLANQDVYRRWSDYAELRRDKDGVGYVVSMRAPRVPGHPTIRQVIAELKPNPRIPFKYLRNQRMREFLSGIQRNRELIASGKLQPEALSLSWLGTLGSIGRGGHDLTKPFREEAAGPAQVLRTAPDYIARTGPTKKGDFFRTIQVRPEILWSMLVSDTTDPKMMKFLLALSRKDAFPTEQARQQAIREGAETLYGRVLASGHGPKQDVQNLLGDPIVDTRRTYTPKRPWGKALPETLQTIQRWARREGEFANLSPREERDRLYEAVLAVRPSGVAATKLRFALAMSVNPEYATLDTRILRDVYGLHPKQRLTRDEYELLSQKMLDANPEAGSLYGAQWLPWEYLTGEKTTYNSLLPMMERVNDYFTQAQQLAQERGVPISEVIDELSAAQPKLDVVPGDLTQVSAQIGVAANQLQPLGERVGGKSLVRNIPELVQMAKQAGVEIDTKNISTGRGFWTDQGRTFDEVDLDLKVTGPVAGIEWFAAALGRAWKQRSVMVSHIDEQGKDQIANFRLRNFDPDKARLLADRLGQELEGWHIGWSKKGANLVAAFPGEDPEKVAAIVKKIRDLLELEKVNIDSIEALPGSVKFIEEAAYDQLIRSGPMGFRSR